MYLNKMAKYVSVLVPIYIIRLHNFIAHLDYSYNYILHNRTKSLRQFQNLHFQMIVTLYYMKRQCREQIFLVVLVQSYLPCILVHF